MSSSNQSSVGTTTYTIGAGVNGISYTSVGGISPTYGAVTISADEIKALTSNIPYTHMSLTADRSEPCITFSEAQPDGTVVKAVFEPENGMSVVDLARIMSLMMVLRDNGSLLKPITYIRKYNLERHFRFSAA